MATYVHPEVLSEVRLNTGGLVVEFAEAGTTVNVRQLTAYTAACTGIR
jgi:hypothetical protein